VLVAVAPPLALLAVTTTADVPAGVPVTTGVGVGVGVAAVLLLPPQPASNSKAIPAKAVASRILALRFVIIANAIPARPSSTKNICGGIPPGICGTKVADRAVVAIVSVTGVAPVAVTEVGLKLQVVAAGKPVQAKVIAPSPPA
jgi:hypothetical protein